MEKMNRECKISAEIIADSKNVMTGDRLTSFVVVIPRIVLAEFNTHRMISRNSASSRAIPFEKMLKKLEESPFIPMKFQKDHSGMQGTEYLEGKDAEKAMGHWLRSRDKAIDCATRLNQDYGVTKQICNRLLEPYMYHKIICTATEWANFMALRAHPAAEIHIARCAELMLEAMNSSTPKELYAGDWHIPFGDVIDDERVGEIVRYAKAARDEDITPEEVAVKIATARCARVSYDNYEGGDDYDLDIKLHDRLSSMGHWSPFEHCAKAMGKDDLKPYQLKINGDFDESAINEISNEFQKLVNDSDQNHIFVNSGDIEIIPLSNHSGNFKGFIQYRKTFEGENKKDERLLVK